MPAIVLDGPPLLFGEQIVCFLIHTSAWQNAIHRVGGPPFDSPSLRGQCGRNSLQFSTQGMGFDHARPVPSSSGDTMLNASKNSAHCFSVSVAWL